MTLNSSRKASAFRKGVRSIRGEDDNGVYVDGEVVLVREGGFNARYACASVEEGRFRESGGRDCGGKQCKFMLHGVKLREEMEGRGTGGGLDVRGIGSDGFLVGLGEEIGEFVKII